MAVNPRIAAILAKYKDMKQDAQHWFPLYQQIGKYVRNRKSHFLDEQGPGPFVMYDVFDNTAQNCNQLMASAMIGAMWPNGARSMRLLPPRKFSKADNPQIKAWYQDAYEIMVEVLDHPDAGFITALEEHMEDQGAFGLSGVSAEEEADDEVPFVFRGVDVKNACVAENSKGMVDTVYITREYTVRQMVQEYGLENLSSELREKYNTGKTEEKHQVLWAIEPRQDRNPFAFGNKNFPIASIHIEVKTGKILKESGYYEMPVFVTRFWKAMGEVRGRSPAMSALPDILELNAIREAIPIAIEKSLDPPLAVMDDGSLGGGVIDTSAGALNVFSMSGRLNGNANMRPVEPINTVGELNSTYARVTELKEDIGMHFFKDRLMDFNNKVKMTLGEAHMRDGLREQSLSAIYNRQYRELFMPCLKRVFNSLLRRGFFGVFPGTPEEAELIAKGINPKHIPEEVKDLILSNKEVYRIEFISPAARIMHSEELMGIRQTAEFVVGLAQVNPEALDNIDLDTAVKRFRELTGTSDDMSRTADEIKAIREQRAQQQQQMMQIEMQQRGTEMARNMAQAQQMAAKAQSGAA